MENDNYVHEDVTKDERTMAMLIHGLQFFVSILAPLIIWLMKKDESKFIDYHGKEALNFQISIFIYSTVAALSMLVLIGFLLLPAIIIAYYVLLIIAAIKANEGEYYKYPLIIRFIK